MMRIDNKIKLCLNAILKISNWWDYFSDYLGLRRGYILYKIGDKKIKTRANSIDKSIITEVLLERKYFPKGLIIKNEATIVDIGAHIGIFSILVSKKNRKVYAIEPSKESFKMLLDQIRINRAKTEIIPFNLAISDKSGKTRLYYGKHSARNSLISKDSKKYRIVKTITLKKFFKNNNIKKCNLLKIDVEGSEYKILYSTPRDIFNKIDNIIMEVHKMKGESIEKLIKFLERFDYNTKVKGSFLYAAK